MATAKRLYLDFDRPLAPSLTSLFAVFRIVGVRVVWLCYRRTRRGWHVIVHLNDRLLPSEAIALQACCGSDGRREALNLMRVIGIRTAPITSRYWIERWNLLYSTKLER